MPDLCTDTFQELATAMGFTCADTGGLIEVRNPFALENWTMPVLEVTIILGAVLALVYAIGRYRRHHDATNLVLWFGAIAYLLIIEPPLYFPGAFGIADHVDTMFAHNLFTVEFLWGRLPLYIVAIYPFMATISFEIVRVLGIFRRYGTLAGAICVGLVHHAFYEIFDHIGPQLRWWEWSLDNPMNQPFFASVPMGSVVVFAALWPLSLAFCVQWFVGRNVNLGKRLSAPSLVWRTVAVGVLASLGTAILPLPATITQWASGGRLQGYAYLLELIAVAVIAAVIFYRQWERLRIHGATHLGGGLTSSAYTDRLMVGYAAVYLGVMALLWLAALPDYFGAVGGRTADGNPTGNLVYVVLCFAIAGLTTAMAMKANSGKTPSPTRKIAEGAPAQRR